MLAIKFLKFLASWCCVCAHPFSHARSSRKSDRRDDRGTSDSRGHRSDYGSDRRHHDRAMGDSDSDASGKLFIGGVSWQTTEVRRLACTPLQARAPNSACVRLL